MIDMFNSALFVVIYKTCCYCLGGNVDGLID